MAPLIPAASLAAALGISALSPALAQTPQPSAPVLMPVPDADGRAPAGTPGQPETPGKILITVPDGPVSSAPGRAVGRAEEPPPVAEQRGSGGGRGGSGRARADAPRGRRPGPVAQRRGGFNGPSAWRPSTVYLGRPYYYDPFWASGAFGWSPLFYAPWSLMWGTAGYGPYPWYGSTAFDTGGLRIKVKPREAQVFVDGFYAGVVNDFDGIFQSLRLPPGGHRIELRMPGFDTISADVHIQPDRTMTITRTMQPSNP